MIPKHFFNDVRITESSIKKARKYFYDGSLKRIDEMLKGETFLNDENDVKDFIVFELNNAKSTLLGDNDYKPYFLQHAYYIQTGESLSLMYN
ncbi:hypothetical protein QI056_02495 [Staphylococcus saprophyticus]|nr:hypothetical protein [Staphylococcus saprophyticus]